MPSRVTVVLGPTYLGPYATQAQMVAGVATTPPVNALGVWQAMRAASAVPVLGMIGDGSDANADTNTALLQASIDSAATNAAASPVDGWTKVALPPGSFRIGQINLKDRVILEGADTTATELVAKNNLNNHLIISNGFSGLTGTNKWLNADGVLSFIGLSKIRINGNKANQTAGDGLRLYAKGLYFNDVIITDCYGNGIYTEAGESGSVNTWPTAPEGRTGFLQILRCGSHGWHMRGPHDLYAGKVTTWLNGGDGLRMESLSSTYLAAADFSFLHSYANTGKGVNLIRSVMRAALLRSENSGQEGLYLEDSDNCELGTVHLFDNCKVSGSFQGVIDGNSVSSVIAGMLIRRSGLAGVGGLQVIGSGHSIRGRIIGDVTGGGNSTGVGLDVANGASYNDIDVAISDFSGVGGTALRTGNTAAVSWNSIRGTLQSSGTLWNNVSAGANNNYDITGNGLSGITKFTGVGPSSGATNRELWNVTLRDATPALVLSEQTLTATVNINSTTEQEFVLAHTLLAAPPIQNVLCSLSNAGNNTTWAVQYIKVQSVSETQIVVRVKLSVASGVAQNATLHVYAKV